MKQQAPVADQILSGIQLSKLVAERVSLKKAGAETKGLCPFHEESSPSFIVNDEKGFFHCFGCGAHGDAIEWIVRVENTSREEARNKLAKQLGVSPKKGGGKLNRSETVTVRLDPKLNYLCELASRSQRRTKSSFIEWAVAEALGSVYLSDLADSDSTFNFTIKQFAGQLWHVDEPDRLVALAISAPALLTHDEQLIWRLVRENGYLWKGRYNGLGEWQWEAKEDSLIRERLRNHWDAFKAVATEDEPESILPTWNKRRAGADLDDDVPF